MPHFLIKTQSNLLSPEAFNQFNYEGITYRIKNRWQSSKRILWEVYISGKKRGKTIFIEQKRGANGYLFKIYKTSKPEIDDGIKRFLLFFAHQIKKMLADADIAENNLNSTGRFKPLIDSEYEIGGLITERPDWEKEFGNSNDIVVEIGFGRGDFLLKLRKTYPHYNIVGIETQPRSVYFAKRKLLRAKESSVRVINISAITALTYLFEPGSISKIFINFPVPWPKKRQANKRLVSNAFSKIAFSRLKKGGTICLATDSKEYFKASKSVFACSGLVESSIDEIYKTEKIGTKYENKWLNEGRSIYICSMKKPAKLQISPRISTNDCTKTLIGELERKKEVILPDIRLKLKDKYSSANKQLYVIDVIGHNLSERLFFDGHLLDVSTSVIPPSVKMALNI